MRILLFTALALLALPAHADYDIKVAKDKGSYVATAVVTGSSTAGTAFISADLKRMDAVVFNNTSTAIWIGTTTVTLNGVTHSNISIGIPVLSSSTFTLEGGMSDNLYFTCDRTVSTCEARVLEGKNR